MNSKFLYGAALSAFVLASCSQESVLDAPVNTDAIAFTVTNGATSRAANSQCNTNMPKSFNVSAFKSGTNAMEDYFMGDQMTKNDGGANSYTQSPLRFWPQYDLDFYAWTNDDGTYTRDEQTGTQQFVNFSPKADVTDQLDLLYAVQPNQSHEARKNVKLNFRHALSQIVFAARNESRLNISIQGVGTSHLYTSNTYTLGNVSTQDNYVNHEELPGVVDNREGLGTWAEFEANAPLGNYAVEFDNVDIKNKTVDLTSVNHRGGPDMSMILLPQTQEKWTPGNAAGVKDEDGYNGFYFTLDLAIYDGNKEVYTGKALVPAQIDWKQGVRYKYTFVFTDHGNSGYKPGDPDNPIEVLAGIYTEISADDFVPAENEDVNINVGSGNEGEEPDPTPDPVVTDVTLSIPAINYSETKQVEDDNTFTFTIPADVVTPEDDYYEFKGWSTTENASVAEYQPNGTIELGANNADVTLYPVLVQVYHDVTLSFDVNGETAVEPLTAKKVKIGEDATFELPKTVEIKDGSEAYALDGWLTEAPVDKIVAFDSEPLEGMLLPGTRDYKTATSKTLYAVYRETSAGSAGGGKDPNIKK